MNRVRGKLILITGASSGIGAACARRFAADGANLVLWARRRERLAELGVELERGHGVAARLAQVDVRDRAAVNRATAELVAAAEVPDVLLNNAGLASGLAKIHEGDPDDWDRMIDTNLKGLLNVTRAILPHMVARRRGHVVNIGSTRSEEHTSELQSPDHLVCRLLLEKKKGKPQATLLDKGCTRRFDSARCHIPQQTGNVPRLYY